jgi:hypothetical protein
VSRRLSLQKGFERLLIFDDAHERIEKALHRGRLQLFRNGELLAPSDIKTGLHLVVEQAAGGRWLCTIVETRGMRVKIVEVDDTQPTQTVTVVLPPSPTWEVDAESVEALRGMRPTERWTTVVVSEFQHLREAGSPLLKKADLQELYGYLSACVEQRTGAPPRYPKRFRRRVRDLLG